MPFRSLEQGVSAIQQGQFAEGARLIRIALKSTEIQGELRATGFLWLAETVADTQQKLDYYTKAVEADPNNREAQRRIAQLMAADLPSSSSGTGPGQSSGMRRGSPPTSYPGMRPLTRPGDVPHVVTILDGPNGVGTGFFVTQTGLLATTRFVVGGQENLRLQIDPEQSVVGQVVRSFPTLDLALIHTGLTNVALPSVVGGASLPENIPLIVRFGDGHQLTGKRRQTRSRVPPEWFPTTIDLHHDAGGSPVFDNRNQLVGMLTRNANRTSDYVFGLHIEVVFRCIEHYQQEIGTSHASEYCPVCGNLSQARGAGGFYCESCGATLPHSLEIARRPVPQMTSLYGENQVHPCPTCRSQVGYYDNKCLRCGTDISG